MSTKIIAIDSKAIRELFLHIALNRLKAAGHIQDFTERDGKVFMLVEDIAEKGFELGMVVGGLITMEQTRELATQELQKAIAPSLS